MVEYIVNYDLTKLKPDYQIVFVIFIHSEAMKLNTSVLVTI